MMKTIDVVVHTPDQKHTHKNKTSIKPDSSSSSSSSSSSPSIFLLTTRTRGVSHSGLAIYIKKVSLRQKKNYGNSKYFTMQIYNLQKNPPKESFKIL
jgi:hypothetical protein